MLNPYYVPLNLKKKNNMKNPIDTKGFALHRKSLISSKRFTACAFASIISWAKEV
jgi:hypothetical protein